MPQRQNTIRLETPDLQGEGSFVVLRRLSWERRQKAQELLADAAGGTLPRTAEDLTLTLGFLQSNRKFTEDLLLECVVAWNWVGDDGQALPLPKDGGLALLSEAEVQFLLLALQPSVEKTKN